MDPKRLKVKITVSVQLQRALNDTGRGIRVLSSEMIGHFLKKYNCICFINTNVRLARASAFRILQKAYAVCPTPSPFYLQEKTELAPRLFRKLNREGLFIEGEKQTRYKPKYTRINYMNCPQEQALAMEEEASEAASFPRPPCPAYAELLEVMERAAGRLQLPWQREREETSRGRLDEQFLSGHNPVTPVSLPFLPDLHVEIEKAWKNPFSARIHTHQRNNFADVEGLRRHGCAPGRKLVLLWRNRIAVGSPILLKVRDLTSRECQIVITVNYMGYGAQNPQRTLCVCLKSCG
ncbi:hypothetical protein DPX16_10942 [Anabarilius grahami]|uniref:Uncharacterized protein n=1 Tax=Anabarilius grahami TaxID=495550 RepID=A0A3N0Y9H7_ANAGA|nr:hypothetical protein DPX16_10942 [Anabarilius grahami]